MGGRWDGRIRAALWVVVAIQSALAVGFTFGIAVAVELMPFPGRTPLTNTFIGSIFAAAAASTAWCLWRRADRALFGIALDYLAILLPFAVYSFAQAATGAAPAGPLVAFGVASLAGVAAGIVLLRWSLGRPWTDPRPLPAAVRWSFAGFIVALVIVSTLLILNVPRILPWTITPELSLLIGCMFLGAAAYFAYGLVDRRWENAGGQLAGFLAYDVVLIVPFLVRLPSIGDDLRPNLLVYTVVVTYSGLLAAYYLFLNPRTRGKRTAQ